MELPLSMQSVSSYSVAMDNTDHADLELRTMRSPAEIEQLAGFNAIIHDDGVGGLTRELALRHPDADRMRWLAITDRVSGDIVSTLCLLPWTLVYSGIPVPAGEMGIVGTHKDWRKRGLIRSLVARFDEILSCEGYLVTHIQGIPYFYRLFGYEYAVPLETQIYLEFRHIQSMNKRGGKRGGYLHRRS
jgi:hypothetical protein